MPVGDQPRLTSFYNSSSSKITGTYSKKRKAESPDGTPLQPPKKGKFKENAAPQRRHLRETIEHDCIVPGEDEHIRKDTRPPAIHTPVTGARLQQRRPRSDVRCTPPGWGPRGDSNVNPKASGMHSQVHGDRETLPTPPPTELLIRQCMPPASPSVKTSGLGSFGSSFDSSFTPGLLQDTSHLPSPRTPVRRKARRSLIAPLGGSSPLTSPPMSPLSGTGAISTPTSPSRRANTQNESISSSCDATLFYPAFVPSSQSFHLKTPRKAVGSARSYPVTGYSIEEPSPFMEPPASPLVAQKTFLEARSADSFSLGTSGPSAPRQRSSSIIPSSQSQELSSFFPPPREVATTRFTIGRSSRISPVRPDHSIVRVGSTGGHCAINEVCHTPDALRHHSHMHARQKSGQLDSSLLLKAVVSLPTTPGYPASRQGLEPRNFPHSVMLSSVDLVPTSQSQVEKDLILPHSNIHLAAADNSVPSGVGSSFSQKESQRPTQIQRSQQPTSTGDVTAFGDPSLRVVIPPSTSHAISTRNLGRQPSQPLPHDCHVDKSVCRKTGTSHQNSVNISEASPTRAVGVLPCRIVSTHHSSVRQLQSATTLEAYGVQEEASDSETEPESDDMCTDPCSVSRSHASRRLESLHSTILGIGRKSQKSQQPPQDDEDSATEPESDDTVSGVTPIMRRGPEPQYVKSPKQMDLDEGSSVPVSQSDDSATEPESDDLPPTLSLLVNLQMSAHVGRSSRPPQDGGDASQVGVGVSSHHVESPRAVSFELQDGSSSLISDTPFSIPSQDLGDIRGTNYWNGSESDSLPSVVAEFLGMFEDDGGMFDDE